MIDNETEIVVGPNEAEIAVLKNTILEVSDDLFNHVVAAYYNTTYLLEEKTIAALIEIVKRLTKINESRATYLDYSQFYGIYGDGGQNAIAYTNALELTLKTLLSVINAYLDNPEDKLFKHISGNAARVLGITLLFKPRPRISWQFACYWDLTNITEH